MPARNSFMYKLFLFFALIFSPLLLVSRAEAEIRYVSDYLTINLKDNLEKPYRVVAKVKSNDPLTILEENETYAKVETEDKQVGWIAKQYLTTSLPKNLVIEQLRKEITDLKLQGVSAAMPHSAEMTNSPIDKNLLSERDRLQTELKAAITRITELQNLLAKAEGQSTPEKITATDTDINQLVEKKQQLESEIQSLQVQFESLSDGSIDVQSIIKEKEELLVQLEEKDKTIATLTAQNHELAGKAMIYWFCAGALVFIVGMLSGKLFSRKKTKYSY